VLISGTFESSDEAFYVNLSSPTNANLGSPGSDTVTIVEPSVTLTSPGDQSNFDGDAVSLAISASDSVGNSLAYSASGLPSGLSINSSTGVISGTIASSADTSSPYSVTVTATDSAADVSASQTFSWAVSPVTVSLTSPGDQTNSDGDTLSLQLSATDNAGHALTYMAEGLPPGLGITPSGEIYGTIANNADANSPYTVSITATAYAANVDDSVSLGWAVSPAVVIVANPGRQSNFDGDTASLAMSASDADGNTVTWSAAGLPPGLTIDPNSGVISGTIPAGADANSPYTVTTTATDSVADASANQTFTWSVAAPHLTVFGISDQANAPGDSVSVAVSAIDSAGHALTFSAANLPDGLSIDAASGLITGTVAIDAVSSTPYAVAITATDAAANISGDTTLDWTVGDIALTNPGTQYNFDGDAVNLALSASATNGDAISYGATGLPPGLSIDASTGVISGTIAAGADAESPYSVTLSATDTVTNASASVDATWNVAATTVAVFGPGDGSSFPGVAVSVGVYVTDSAEHALTFSATNLPAGLTIDPTTGTITGTVPVSGISATPYNVTVTATDSAADIGASTSFNWTITAISLTNPGVHHNLVGDTADLTLSASDALGNAISFGATNLPAGLSINATSGAITGSPTTAGVSVVTATATDSVTGASASQTFAWIVNQITLQDPGSQLSATGASINLTLTANAPAGDPINFAATGLPPGLTVNSTSGIISGTIAAGTSGDFVVTLTATDTTTGASAGGEIWWVVAAPVDLAAPGNQQNYDGDAVSLQLSATSSACDPLFYSVASATPLPAGLSLDPWTGVISGTVNPGDDASSPYTITVSATDATTGVTAPQTFTWSISAVTVSLTSPGNQTNDDGDLVALQLAATDSAGHALSYSVTPSTPLPSGLTLDPGSGRIFGIVGSSDDQSSPYTVTLVATDSAAGVSALQTITWTVNAGSGGSFDSVTAEENQPYAFAPSDFGISPGDGTAGVQITSLPTGGTLTDSGTPVTLNQNIPLSDLQNSGLVYTPDQNEFGADYDNFNFAPYTNGGPGGDPTIEINVAQQAQPAFFRVTLPLENAQVFVNGAQTTTTGDSRLFQTQPFTGSQTNTIRVIYTIGQFTVEDVRQVVLTPGQTANVDFTQPGQGTVSVSAVLTVRVPTANATVTLDGAPTTTTGTTRTYTVPPLQAGRTFSYVIVATWTDSSNASHRVEQRVTVSAGQVVEVDLGTTVRGVAGPRRIPDVFSIPGFGDLMPSTRDPARLHTRWFRLGPAPGGRQRWVRLVYQRPREGQILVMFVNFEFATTSSRDSRPPD
jgi:uncharacterized protein (TIGR03000 family)